MSAIFGVYQLDGGWVDQALLNRMDHALTHRGPAGSGQWLAGSVGLGYRALATPRESLVERQPLAHRAAGLVLVADARIDNREELAVQLGLRAAEATDGQLILEAYLKWGAECPLRLIGDFAFAIWDERDRSLFCARDPMGVKPFYYHHSDRLFAFATEIKALHRIPSVPRQVHDEQIAHFLMWTQSDREYTLFEGINRLPAAHSMRIRPGRQPKMNRYWSLDPSRELRYTNADDYTEEFRSLFEEAVRCRMRSARPIATALSGGLDSSSITCVARRIREVEGGESLHAVSLVFNDLPADDQRVIDERCYIDSVVSGGGFDWHPVDGTQLSPLQDALKVLWHLDEPSAAPNLFLHWGLYRKAAESGAGVFLDGLDGDSTVSHGLGRLNTLLGAGDWDTFEAEVRAFARHRGIDPEGVLGHFGLPYLAEQAQQGRWISWGRSAAQMAGRFAVSRRDLVVRHGLGPAVANRVRWAAKASPKLAEARVLRPELASRLPAINPQAERVTPERESHCEGLSQPAYQLTLEIADKCAAAFGLEPRYPFFDRRLMEFCLAVPGEEKFAGGWPRLLFRRAMEGILPSDVQWRSSKANLSPAFQRGFRSEDRQLVEGTDLSMLERYVDPGALGQIRSEYFADPNRRRGDADSYLLFRSTLLAMWQSGLRADQAA